MTKNNTRTKVQFFLLLNGMKIVTGNLNYPSESVMQNFHPTQTIINMEQSRYQVIETKKIDTSQIKSVYNESNASRCSLLFT